VRLNALEEAGVALQVTNHEVNKLRELDLAATILVGGIVPFKI
jgi:hypothetical protein